MGDQTREETCGKCKWFDSAKPDKRGRGRCRKNPPQVVREDTYGWLPVKPTDWCGQFSRSPQDGDVGVEQP